MSFFKMSLRPLAIASLVGVLAACVVPEQYEAKLSLYGDELSVEFEGTLREFISVSKNGGQPINPDDPQLKELLSELSSTYGKQSGYTSARVTDDNRIFVTVNDTRKISDEGFIYGLPETQHPKSKNNFLKVQNLGDGEVLVSSAKIKPKDLASLMEVGFEPAGTLLVSTDYEVLEHNADENSGWLSDSYVWKLDSREALLKGVKMRLKMK